MIEDINLRASQTRRWTNCPPSFRLSAMIAGSELNVDDFYANEGTLMHELVALEAERMLTPKFDTKEFQQEYQLRLASIQADSLYDTEMLDYVESYLEKLREHINDCQARQKEFSFYLEHTMQAIVNGVNLSGTADSIIETDDTLYITDFKYGMGIFVDAQDNDQLMMYALLYMLTTGKSFKNFSFSIVQPRIDNVQTFTYPLSTMQAFNTRVLQAIEDVVENKGQMAMGDWCKYCKAKPRCPKYKELYDDMMDSNLLPALMTDAETVKVLKQANFLVSWLSEVKELAYQRAIKGHYYPGYKLVEKRRRRVIPEENQDAVAATLIASGYSKDTVFETKLLPITKLEKAMGKKQFKELLDDYIAMSPQTYDLVSNDDRRPAAILDKPGDEF